jgi:serine phosphatase RsbU (regulator of sigma subunit)
LHKINDRLVGRTGGGFTTALVAHIRPDGRMVIANAGHLPPYLDGRELYLPGALPLGLTADPVYESTWLQLGKGSRLTFYSDGVVEAQNQKGELFGFERGCELSTRKAGEIAAAAKAFGQRDDITVVTIERVDAATAAA